MSLLLESISAGLANSRKRELLALNTRIESARKHLRQLEQQRESLLNGVDTDAALLASVQIAADDEFGITDLQAECEASHAQRLAQDESQEVPAFADQD